MVGLIRQRIYDAPEVDALGVDSFTESSGEVLAATAGATFNTNPATLLYRWGEREGRYNEPFIYDEMGNEQPSPLYVPTPMLSAEEANDRYGIGDQLKWDQPVREGIAQELHKLKREELRRMDILSRSPGGFGLGVAQFGVGLAVSALDPINVASAFVPVVGPARYGAMLAKASGAGGRFAVRAGVGATEGALGAALVEPLVYGLAQSEQQEYDALDSLMNVGMGIGLGGGLRSIGGVFADRITGQFRKIVNTIPNETHVGAMNSTIAQIVEGRPVDVEAVFRASLLESTHLTSRRTDIPKHVFGYADPIDPTFKPAPMAYNLVDTIDVDPVVRIGLGTKRDGSVPVHPTREAAEKAAAKISRKDGVDTDVIETADGFVVRSVAEAKPVRNPDGTVLTFPNERAAQKFIDRTPSAQGRALDIVPHRADGKASFAIVENANDAELNAIKARPDAVDWSRGPDYSAAGALERDAYLQGQLKDRATASLDRAVKAQVDSMTGIDPEYRQAVANVNARVVAARAIASDSDAIAVLDRELAELEADVNNLVEVGDADPELVAIYKAADDDIASAVRTARQLELTAACIVGNP